MCVCSVCAMACACRMPCTPTHSWPMWQLGLNQCCPLMRSPALPALPARQLPCPAGCRSLSAAQDATEFDPLKAKYWARMGDAHKGLGQAPLALLCYEQALKLAPRDQEIQPRCGRQAGGRSVGCLGGWLVGRQLGRG